MTIRRWIGAVAAISTVLGSGTVALVADAAAGPQARVVVLGEAKAPAEAASAVARLGGAVERRFDAIGGLVASVPRDRIAALAATPGVRSVSADRPVHLAGDAFDSSADAGSLLRTAQSVRATTGQAATATGQGVDVALVDSGISPVGGLNANGKVVNGPDISFDSQAKAKNAYVDNYGHGTHIAGIIAGNGGKKGDDFTGIAPGARLVNVKVADANGAVDVSQVIAAIDWVVQHRTDNGLNIRVLNLSFGTDSSQDYRADPLSFAAEVAWRAGIVVVSAAGNRGTELGRLMNPAVDPFVLAVGSDEAKGTPDVADDTISAFSSRGDGVRNPDVVAPGRSIVSLRDPGSFIDTNYPNARVTKRLFRGSGTSQATAVVSGVVADLLQQRPGLTPDQVKAVLTSTASVVPGADTRAQGAGLVNLDAALASPIPQTAQAWDASAGTGSLDAARGSLRLVHDGVALTGEQDIFGHAFDSGAMAAAEAAQQSWNAGVWNGSSWSGSSWSGSSWSGSSWSGSTWSGSSWSGSSWSGSSWSGSSWSGTWGDPQATTTTCTKHSCSAEDQSNSHWGD